MYGEARSDKQEVTIYIHVAQTPCDERVNTRTTQCVKVGVNVLCICFYVGILASLTTERGSLQCVHSRLPEGSTLTVIRRAEVIATWSWKSRQVCRSGKTSTRLSSTRLSMTRQKFSIDDGSFALNLYVVQCSMVSAPNLA